MSKSVYVFTYKNVEIHTRFIEGEYWFVATDIVRAVGASAKNTTQIIRKLPEPSRVLYLHEIPTRPNGINTWHIDETGLRLLLDWPTKPEAALLLNYIESEILSVLPLLPTKEEELEAVPSVAKPSENVPMVIPKEEPKEVQEDVLSVRINQSQEQVVSGRMLHTFLNVGTRYNDWFTRMCAYGFIENVDYRAITQKKVTQQGNESVYTDHELRLDMAKEICMLARNERGKQARQYFLQLEKDWNSPEKVMARALLMANLEIGDLKVLTAQQEEKIIAQAETIATLEPKAKIYDKVMNTESTCTVSDVAISNGWQSSALFKLLRANGWLDKSSNAKHHVSRKAPKGVFKVIKGIYGEQIRVTQEGYKQITALIKENE